MAVWTVQAIAKRAVKIDRDGMFKTGISIQAVMERCEARKVLGTKLGPIIVFNDLEADKLMAPGRPVSAGREKGKKNRKRLKPGLAPRRF